MVIDSIVASGSGRNFVMVGAWYGDRSGRVRSSPRTFQGSVWPSQRLVFRIWAVGGEWGLESLKSSFAHANLEVNHVTLPHGFSQQKL